MERERERTNERTNEERFFFFFNEGNGISTILFYIQLSGEREKWGGGGGRERWEGDRKEEGDREQTWRFDYRSVATQFTPKTPLGNNCCT